jgi:hypothetical protein
MTSGPTTYQNVRLSRGRHYSPKSGACVMELASMLAGERFTDRPRAVCPVIASFLRAYNDLAPAAWRQDLVAGASRVVGSRRPGAYRRRIRHCALVAVEIYDEQPWWRRLMQPGRRSRLLRIANGPTRPYVVEELGVRLAQLVKRAPAGRAMALEIVEDLVRMGEPRLAPVELAAPELVLA